MLISLMMGGRNEMTAGVANGLLLTAETIGDMLDIVVDTQDAGVVVSGVAAGVAAGLDESARHSHPDQQQACHFQLRAANCCLAKNVSQVTASGCELSLSLRY